MIPKELRNSHELERFKAKVEKTDNCWLWRGTVNNRGYGIFGLMSGKVMNAHRWAFLTWVGPIPEKCDIHHQCEVRLCVNPMHLIPMSHSEHMAISKKALKTHCYKGHSLETFYKMKKNTRRGFVRRCKVCQYEAVKRWASKNQEKVRQLNTKARKAYREREKAKKQTLNS